MIWCARSVMIREVVEVDCDSNAGASNDDDDVDCGRAVVGKPRVLWFELGLDIFSCVVCRVY